MRLHRAAGSSCRRSDPRLTARVWAWLFTITDPSILAEAQQLVDKHWSYECGRLLHPCLMQSGRKTAYNTIVYAIYCMYVDITEGTVIYAGRRSH